MLKEDVKGCDDYTLDIRGLQELPLVDNVISRVNHQEIVAKSW